MNRMRVMGLTKHEQLAKCLRQMIKNIEAFAEKVDKFLQNFAVGTYRGKIISIPWPYASKRVQIYIYTEMKTIHPN